MSGHGHDDTMANDHYGGGDLYEEGNPSDSNLTKLQIFMSRSLVGWPLYTIIISLGQLLSAVRLPQPFLADEADVNRLHSS